MKDFLASLIDDPEADRLLAEAEEELKRLSPKKRRDLFGTDWLPPSPEDFLPVSWDDDEVLPTLF